MSDSFTTNIYVFDFEFHPTNGIEGNSPDPVCMVVLDLNTGVTYRYFREQLQGMEEAPFDTGPDSLWIAFYAAAEMDCFIQLGWSLPDNVLDLFVEFRNSTNGLTLRYDRSLLGVMSHYGNSRQILQLDANSLSYLAHICICNDSQISTRRTG